MIIQCRRSSAWESTRPMWGEAEDRAVVSSNLTDGIIDLSRLFQNHVRAWKDL